MAPLPAGRYFVGVETIRDGLGDDWAFGTITVASRIEIAALKLDSECKKPGEKIRAKVTLSAAPIQGSTIRFDVLDNFGRCVCRRVLPAEREVEFEGDFAESLHIYNHVDVALLDPVGATLAETRHAFYVAQPGPPRDDVSWMVWEAGTGFDPRRRNLLKQFARLGMTGALTGSLEPIQSAAMANAHPVLYAYKMTGVSVNDNGVTNPCFTDPAYRAYTIRHIQDEATRYAPFSPLFFYLGDDVRYITEGQDACWSPTCRASLVAWARQRYETIEAVNRAWGTSYRAFDDILPIKRADVVAAMEKGSSGSLCHWVDHQLWANETVAGWWREMGKGIRQAVPDTPSNMGSSVVGWTWPGSGIDFWQLAEGKDLVFQYPNPWVHDVFRCAARRDAFHGTWYGGYGLYNYPPYYDGDYLPWWSVFRGVNLHGLYYGGQGQRWYSERLLGADLGPMPVVAKMLGNLDELKGGIAKLLFNAERINDGVAIVYAPANIHASLVFARGLPKAPEWEGQVTASNSFIYMQCWGGMSDLISDMGFDYHVIPSSHLKDGRLLDKGCRVVVLPFHIRVTEAEAKAIRRFVHDGGVLIADVLTGTFDGRCRADHAGVLADVFGAKLAGGVPDPKVRRCSASTNAGVTLGELVADGGLTLDGADAGAKTADGTPLLLVHRYGKGSAILLNVLVRDYQIWRTSGTEMSFRDTIAGLLADRAGLKPAIRCDVHTSGVKQPHRIQVTEFHRYELGGASYVGLLRHPKLRPDDAIYMADLRPKPAWITFDRKAHVYDVRRRMYRGMTDHIEDVIYAGRAELFALMPYEVRDLKLAADLAGGAIALTAQIVLGDPKAEAATHVLHVEVRDPSGCVRRKYSRSVIAPKGRLRDRIFLGLNAQSGTWRVTVRDVASGMQQSCTVSI